LLKERLAEEDTGHGERAGTKALAEALVRCGKREEAIQALAVEFEKRPDLGLATLILETEHGKRLPYRPFARGREVRKLSSWKTILTIVSRLEEPQRSRFQTVLYKVYRVSPE